MTDVCYEQHGHQEFLSFLKKVARAYPRRKLHVVVDNDATHKHPEVDAWLLKHPRITLHFTPTSGSWPNLVEVFFSIITCQATRRGTFVSVKDLVAVIRRFIDAWNDRCYPFTWSKHQTTPSAVRNRVRRLQTQDTSITPLGLVIVASGDTRSRREDVVRRSGKRRSNRRSVAVG